MFKILPSPLHVTANAAIKWFKGNWGISKSSLKIEEEIHSEVELRPTFSAQTTDFHLLCVEVAETAYTNSLDACVLTCNRLGLPVKLFVAMPKGIKDPDFVRNFKAAQLSGVGLTFPHLLSHFAVKSAGEFSLI